MKIIKKLRGNSGATVELVEINKKFLINKTKVKNVQKSLEILKKLRSEDFLTPKIYSHSSNHITMEFVNGDDMQTYLESADNKKIIKLIDFIENYINIKNNNKKKNFSREIYEKISVLKKKINQELFIFNLDQLYTKLPKLCTDTNIHGDLTLDNIIHQNNNFYLIDPNPTDITALEYDVIKIRQDLDCLWFVRKFKNKNNFKIVCNTISTTIKNKWNFFKNDYILIFMLLRVLPYTKDTVSKKLLIDNINSLWR